MLYFFTLPKIDIKEKSASQTPEKVLREWLRVASNQEDASLFIGNSPIFGEHQDTSGSSLPKVEIPEFINSIKAVEAVFKKEGLKDEEILNYILHFGGINGYMTLGQVVFEEISMNKGKSSRTENRRYSYRVKNKGEVEYIEQFDFYKKNTCDRNEIGDFIGQVKIVSLISKDGDIQHACKKVEIAVPGEKLNSFRKHFGDQLNFVNRMKLRLVELYNSLVERFRAAINKADRTNNNCFPFCSR
ncbi:Dot/Icm T4SS effector CpeB [Coxiella burnetii]|uniref:Dot/Icm T4SS effector CpeB n=1 Tax=Coxiella burnetii TaxID=777 RepID=UPI00051F16E4|nr:Dot/Icm T4SS effector CpeB [Coxiella burnetii]AIT64329.1 Hypothetical protein CBNA_2152 [Coxiella burnetii str. Namibia]